MNDRFIRQEMLLGTGTQKQLAQTHIAVFGLGGVGGFAVEALARSGIGMLSLIDSDCYSLSNINRQIGALTDTIGRAKAEVMSERVREINPEAQIFPFYLRYSADNRELFFQRHFDFIIDAIDLVSCKLDLIESANKRAIPIISALGTGNKLDPFLFEITDISKTRICPLARVVRKELRKRGISRHTVLYSTEEPRKPGESGEELPPGRRSIPGSVSWVPACAGLMLAAHVIRVISRNYL